MQRTFEQQTFAMQRIAQARREGAEIERQRIYQNLHDGIGTRLVIALYKLRAGSLNHQEIEDVLITSMNDIQKIIDFSEDGAPIDLLRELFARCIEMEDFFANSNVHFSYAIPADARLSLLNRVAADILFIFQEIIANFLKHSAAQQIHVSVTLDHGFCLSVEESAYPCDERNKSTGALQKPLPSSSQGLHNIQTRAVTIDADVEIVQNESHRMTTLRLRRGGKLPQNP